MRLQEEAPVRVGPVVPHGGSGATLVPAMEDHQLAIGHLGRDIEVQLEITEIGLHARIDVGAEFRIDAEMARVAPPADDGS